MRRASIQGVLVAVAMASGVFLGEGVFAQGYPPGLMPRARNPQIMNQSVQRPYLYGTPGVIPGNYGFYGGFYGRGGGLYPPMGMDIYGAVPQTRRFKYPAPQYDVPKLGLQYLYPYGYQFGLQLPYDTDEPLPYDEPDRMRRGAQPPSMAEAADLMKKGKYIEAGRLLARDLRDENAPPEQYLLIAEALWAAGKTDDAEIVLRHAIETAPSLDFLDRADLAGKFASADAMKEKVGAIPGDHPLLAGTMNILAGQREKGLDVLRGVAPADPAARRVYLHFLGAAFGPEPAPAPAAEKKAPGKAAPEKAAPPPPK